MTRAGTTEQRTAMRARIILRAAEGAAHVVVADELGVSVPTVLLWRRRFKERGLAGLADAPHPGRPRTYGRVSSRLYPLFALGARKAQADSGARH